MSVGKFDEAGAGEVFCDLNRNMLKTPSYQGEINVSFRDIGGAVGRRDYATHMIHWYPAKMFHRIPSVFLDTIELPNKAKILDPFCGSGTVLLEANLRGHDAIGLDINPLARLISRVKVTVLNPSSLKDQLHLLLTSANRVRSKPTAHSTLDYWLSPSARLGLHRLITAIEAIEDADSRAFFLVTLTSIIRRVSKADPAIPPLVRLREERAETAGARYRQALKRSRSVSTNTVNSDFADAACANIRRMAELYFLQSGVARFSASVLARDAAATDLGAETIDTIITSPPYCGAQKYVRSLKLELLLSGCADEELRQIDRRTLGTEAVPGRVFQIDDLLTGNQYVDQVVSAIYGVNPVRARMASDYSKYLTAFASECQQVIRPGGHLLVTLGRSTLAGIPFLADRIFRQACRAVGLESIATLVDRIASRGLLTQRHRTAGRIDHEFIVWLRRPPNAVARASVEYVS